MICGEFEFARDGGHKFLFIDSTFCQLSRIHFLRLYLVAGDGLFTGAMRIGYSYISMRRRTAYVFIRSLATFGKLLSEQWI